MNFLPYYDIRLSEDIPQDVNGNYIYDIFDISEIFEMPVPTQLAPTHLGAPDWWKMESVLKST